jgi:outer membrane protein
MVISPFLKSAFVLCVLILCTKSHAQDFTPLVQRAWQENASLKSKTFQLEASEAALREAKAMYGPNLGFNTQYTLAVGGRSIDLPVGDLLNPAYSALNQLTNTNNFPQIENTSIQFLPSNFYDAKLRLSQPIYYPDLAINKQLKTEAVRMRQLEIIAFKRQLSKEVMQAYIQYQMSREAMTIYQSADTLLREAARTITSMIRNGIALPSALARVEIQLTSVQAQIIDNEANTANARKYLLYLVPDSAFIESLRIPLRDVPSAANLAFAEREELAQISQGMRMQEIALAKEDQFYKPRVAAQLDLGSQAFNFGLQPYALLGLNFDLNLYDHKRHNHKKSQVQSELNALAAQKDQVNQQITLQTAVAKQNLDSGIRQALTWQPRIQSAQKIYQEMFLKYKEGTANYLELMDAQSQITQVQTQYYLAKLNAWMKWADYMYATASFPIPN